MAKYSRFQNQQRASQAQGLHPGMDYENLLQQAQELQNRAQELNNQAAELQLEQAREAAQMVDYANERDISPQLRPENISGIRKYLADTRKEGETPFFTNVLSNVEANPDAFYFEEGGPTQRAKDIRRQLAQAAELAKLKATEGKGKQPIQLGDPKTGGVVLLDPDTYEEIGSIENEPVTQKNEMTGEVKIVGYKPGKFTRKKDFALPDDIKRQLLGGGGGQRLPIDDLAVAHQMAAQSQPQAPVAPQQLAMGLGNMMTAPLKQTGEFLYNALTAPQQEQQAPVSTPIPRGRYTEGPTEEDTSAAMGEMGGLARKLGFSMDNPYYPPNLLNSLYETSARGGQGILDLLGYLANQQGAARREYLGQ